MPWANPPESLKKPFNASVSLVASRARILPLWAVGRNSRPRA